MKAYSNFPGMRVARRTIEALLPALLFSATGLSFQTGVMAADTSTRPASTAAKAPETKISTRLVLLGTEGGPVVDAQRSGIASLLVVGGRPYLIDCGIGTVRRLKQVGYEPGDITRVFITHLHMDHTADLGALGAFGWTSAGPQPMQVYGPPGTKRTVDGAHAFYAEATDIFATQLPPRPPLAQLFKGTDVDAGASPTVIYQDDLIRVLAVENSHYQTIRPELRKGMTWKSYSYRVETPDRVIVFSGDTGPSDALISLAQGADILVSEALDLASTMALVQSRFKVSAAALEPMAEHMRHEHLEGAEIGKIANAAKVKMVVLSHFGPNIDPVTNKIPYIERVKKYYDGPVILGNDLQQF